MRLVSYDRYQKWSLDAAGTLCEEVSNRSTRRSVKKMRGSVLVFLEAAMMLVWTSSGSSANWQYAKISPVAHAGIEWRSFSS